MGAGESKPPKKLWWWSGGKRWQGGGTPFLKGEGGVEGGDS